MGGWVKDDPKDSADGWVRKWESLLDSCRATRALGVSTKKIAITPLLLLCRQGGYDRSEFLPTMCQGHEMQHQELPGLSRPGPQGQVGVQDLLKASSTEAHTWGEDP